MISPSEGRARPLHLVLLRWVAVAAAIGYVAWNAWWLAQRQIPPAMFYGLTGLPAPTTGGMRAMWALANGQWMLSLRYNAIAVPMAVLLGYCILYPGVLMARRQRPSLPRWVVWAWIVLLAAAWPLKLFGDRAYW